MFLSKIKSFLIAIHKLILIIIALLLILLFSIISYNGSKNFATYELNILNPDLIVAFLTIIMAYFYLIISIIIMIGFFRAYNKVIYYVIFLTPIIPVLFIYSRIYQSIELVEEYLFILFLLYFLLFLSTLFVVKNSSFNIIRSIAVKDLFEIQDDYSYISIFSKTSHVEGNIVILIRNIISNILKYKLEYIENINIDGKKYEIYNYVKQEPFFLKFHKKNILLIKFDVISSENNKQIEIVDMDDKSDINESDGTINKCVYLYQFYDDGDKISHLRSTFQDVYLALKGILPNDSLIVYHKDDDITSPEIWDLRSKVFEKYLLTMYGTFIERIDIKIKDIVQRLKEPHKRFIKYGVIFIIVLVLIIYMYSIVHNYLSNLKIETILPIGLLIPPAIYYSIKIYDRLKK